MKYLGKKGLRVNDKEVWHEGNFNPTTKADIEHVSDTMKHITLTERTNWNDANNKKHEHSNKSIIDTITQALIDTWNTVTGKADKTYVDTELGKKANTSHNHVKANITDFPTSMPANGGNADTVGGKSVNDFQQLTNGGAYGIFPSTANTMVGNEYNILLYAQKRGYTVTQSGSTTLNLYALFDGKLAPTYSSDGVDPDNPLIITISGLPNVHTQTGGVFGWTCRYWYPYRYKIEAYDSYQDRGWKILIDRSATGNRAKELLIPIYPSHSGSLTQFRITIYETTGSIGANGFRRAGISEIFFCHPEAAAVNDYLDYLYSELGHKHTKFQITDMPTKLSQFENDIGAGAGLNIVVSATQPSINAGDWWYKEI